MSDQILERLLDHAPQTAFLLVLVLAVAFVLRESRAIRRDLFEEIETRVKAELGAVLTDIQKQIENARIQLTEGEAIRGALRAESGQFQEQMKAAKDEAARILDDLRDEAQRFRDLVPKANELSWVSPQELITRARGANSWQEAYGHLAAIDADNATSKDLELAGDICREHRFFKKAIEFYRAATGRDPDNVSAQVELAALTAEFDANDRQQSLARLRALASSNIRNDDIIKRYFNVLIELNRYDELHDFAAQHVESKDLPPSCRSALSRNLATAHKRLGRIEQARTEYESALAVLPNDENTLKAYAGLLMETEDFAEAASYFRRLIAIDPTDAAYFYGLGRAMHLMGHLRAAVGVLVHATTLVAGGTLRYLVEEELAKLQAKLTLDHSYFVPGEESLESSGGRGTSAAETARLGELSNPRAPAARGSDA